MKQKQRWLAMLLSVLMVWTHAPYRRTACIQGLGGEERDLHTHIWYSRRE